MSALTAFILLAAVSTGPAAEQAKTLTKPVTQPSFKYAPKDADGLSLFNVKGEVVARCDKKDEGFDNCKMEPGYSLDDLMNAWVHAYEDLAK
jgi:hypothetical protein